MSGETKSDYKANRSFADAFTPQLCAILKENASLIVEFIEASEAQDKNEATDYILRVKGSEVAARVRRQFHGDITIRSFNGGHNTELEKLKAGWAKWYLYAWVSGEEITKWILLDLDCMRSGGILDYDWPERENTDGRTRFICIALEHLAWFGCIKSSAGLDLDPAFIADYRAYKNG